MATPQELITKAKDFKSTDVTYGTPKVNKKGGKSISVLLNGQRLVLQFPLMFTWGVNAWDSDDGSYKKYDLNLSWGTKDASTSEGQFFKAMEDFQNKILDDAVGFRKEWFGKSKLSKEVADALMYPILKYPKDKATGEPNMDANPSMKLKLMKVWGTEDTFKLELYDMAKQALYLGEPQDPNWENASHPEDLIPKRSHIKGLMECTGLWFAGGKFGIGWKLVQAQVRAPVTIKGFCLLDDSDDDEVAAVLDAVDKQPSFAVDSDHSDEATKSKKKKKVVRKKKKSAAAQ